MSGDTQSFVETIRRNHLLSPAQLADLTSYIATVTPDPQALANALVERQWLTTYQVRQILEAESRDLVLGPYILLDFLGEGGMGRVYRARHERLERLTALKIIRQDRLADAETVGRFLREARAAARLSHPNIVTVYDAGEHQGTHYLAMEYIEGADLGRLVRQCGPLTIEQSCDSIRQVALGLQHAFEQGLVHRDIKPSNLIQLAGQGVVKIVDFGLARLAADSASGELTLTGQVMGTPDFIAPEQADDSHTADIRSDIYSLGCTLFYLLTGKPAFPGHNVARKLAARSRGLPAPLSKLRPDAPAALEAMLERMLAFDPSDRFQTPADVAQACETLAQGGAKDPLLASTQNWQRQQAKPGRRHALLTTAILGSVLVAATVLFHLRPPMPEAGPKNSAFAKPVETRPSAFTNSIGMRFVLIPSGKFLMGCPITEPGARADEGPVHEVTLTRPFHISAYEVTQAEFQRVMEENPSWFTVDAKGMKHLEPDEDTRRLPVENVTWHEATEFCKRLSKLVAENGRRYRLPTEAEWEYACRAGTQTAYAFGVELFPDQANFGDRPRTRPVGSYPANAFGVHDMHGNVWEWCLDTRASYPAESQTDPVNNAETGDRVLRGGGWRFNADECRSASRVAYEPSFRSQYHGFRVVCEDR